MRVGLLTTSFPQHNADPSGRFVMEFAEALANRGHRVDVLVPAPAHCPPSSAAPRHHDGICVVPVRYAVPSNRQQLFYGAGAPENVSNRPWLASQLPTFSIALAAAAWRYRNRWQGVVSHWSLPCAIAACCALPRLPHLAVCHSADVHALSRVPAGRWLRQIIQRQVRALWFVSKGHRDRFVVPSQRTLPRIHVSPMGISPPNGLLTTPRIPAEPGSRLRAVTLGRLVPVKGIPTAIAAVDSRKSWELLIAGDGPDRGSLHRLTDHTSRMRLVGGLDSAQKWSFLQGAHAFLLPSIVLEDGRTEGVPVALLEAMACGLPIIASRVGGVSDLVTDGREGLLVPPGAPQAIASALDRLRQAPNLASALGSNSRRRATQYTWEKQAAMIESLLWG